MISKQKPSEVGLLTETIDYQLMFTPEEFTDVHRMMAETADKFTEKEVVPVLDKLESGQLDLSVGLLKQAGELGLLGIDIPEEYGGTQLDKISSTIITENIARGRSFNVTFSGQVGIGSLPIVYFGNKNQKKAYLPEVASGEKIGAYALTEPTSGTDALAARTTATQSDCGQYFILNGEKQFITNSAFADFFIVFAKINKEKFTAFIVNRDSAGLTIGTEEKKMGLKGSSTCSLILENVRVPVGNLLGEAGKGHKIAFNILNIGRHKIAATCLGTSKHAIELAIKHAKQRQQFGKPISEFSLIKQKIANMAIQTYVNESMIYRTAELLDRSLQNVDLDGNEISVAISRCAIECSINKVFSSEVLDSIIDEAVQIHGGYGFIAEYEVETLYRDSRINRIFEGTNEINRIVIASHLLHRIGEDKETVVQKIHQKQDYFYDEKLTVDQSKILLRNVIQFAKKQFAEIDNEQELLAVIADAAIDIYAMESALMRTEKACVNNSFERETQKISYTRSFLKETSQKFVIRLFNLSAYMCLDGFIADLEEYFSHVFQHSKIDLIAVKREIASKIINQERYCV